MESKEVRPGFKEENLNDLDPAQREQIFLQWLEQQHQDFQVDFKLTPFGEVLPGFLVKKGVWNPSFVSARHHAAYLYYHSSLYCGKKVIDVGCGTGLMGVVMAKYGANKVVMSDVSEDAVSNTRQNIDHFGLVNASAVVSDLFGNIEEKADCITFMLPYFSGKPPQGDTISSSMLAGPELLKRFLNDVPIHLNPGGVIVMPSYSLAGNGNNAAVAGKEYGFEVSTPFMALVTTGLQRGTIAMHELRKR